MPKRRKLNEISVADGKVNPHSLTRLLIDIRQEIMPQKSITAFAKILTAAGNHYADNLVTGNRVSGIEENKIPLRYLELEKYAHSIGLPTGLLLVFSRMVANEMHAGEEHNVSLAQRLVALFSMITENTKFLTEKRTRTRTEKIINQDELERWRTQWKTPVQQPLPMNLPTVKSSDISD